MIIIGILLFALLIVVHELGHFWSARRAGVEVEEFGIGFPPRLFARRSKNGKTIYSVNLIPLGGFVKLKGESDSDRRRGSFGRARFKNKVIIMVAGVAMNLVAALVILLLLAWFGMPRLFPGQFTISSDERGRQDNILVVSVADGTAAAKLGIKPGDRLLALNSQPISDSGALTTYTHAHPDQEVTISWQHQEQVHNETVRLGKTDAGQGQLGVVPFDDIRLRYTWAAPIVALVVLGQLVGLTLVGLAQLIVNLISIGPTQEVVAGVTGPVGLVALFESSSQLGIPYLLVLTTIISVSLAVFNILPIPALDGGRLALISIFRLIKKPLSPKVETAVHSIGFVALIVLVVLISYLDVKRFF